MTRMHDVISELQSNSFTVTSQQELSGKYRNIHTQKIEELIGSYTIRDGVRSYGPIYVFRSGDRWAHSDFLQHWESA